MKGARVKDQMTKREELEWQVRGLKPKELKELLLLTMFKLEMTRAQLDALTDLLAKKKVVDAKKLWEETGRRFEV